MVVKYEPRGARRNWRDDALCLQFYTELFHPERGGDVREGKQVCARCPVRERCLQEALRLEQTRGAQVTGIWGGTTQRERQRMLGRRAAA